MQQSPQCSGRWSLDEGGEQDGDGGGGEDGGDRVADAEQGLLLVVRPARPRQPAARPALQLHQQRPGTHGRLVRLTHYGEIGIYFLRCMNSVGVFGKGFDCLFGEESRFTAKSSISSMIVSMSKWDVFLDSFLLAAARADAPVPPVLFMFSTPLLLLSSCLAPPPPPSFPSPDSAMGPNPASLSPALEPALSKSSLTVVRQLFWDTCSRGEDRSGARVPGAGCYLPGRGWRPRPGLLAAHLQVLPLAGEAAVAAGVEAEAGAARLGGLWNKVDVITRMRGSGC